MVVFCRSLAPNIQPSRRHPTYLSPVHGGHPCTTSIPTSLPLSSTELQNASTMPFSLSRKTSDARCPPSEREGNFKTPRFIPLRTFDPRGTFLLDACESLVFFNRYLPVSLKHCTTLLIPKNTINRLHTIFADLNIHCLPTHSQYPCETSASLSFTASPSVIVRNVRYSIYGLPLFYVYQVTLTGKGQIAKANEMAGTGVTLYLVAQ